MDKVNNISVEQAAISYSERSFPNHAIAQRPLKECLNYAFQAGAQWQKEQGKYLVAYMSSLADRLELEGFTATCTDIREAIEKYNH